MGYATYKSWCLRKSLIHLCHKAVTQCVSAYNYPCLQPLSKIMRNPLILEDFYMQFTLGSGSKPHGFCAS